MQTEYWIRPSRVVSPYTYVLRSPADAAIRAEGWVPFTPLQEWRDVMRLLDCVPLRAEIPRVGIRIGIDMYMFF
jgi:hypothetical protein